MDSYDRNVWVTFTGISRNKELAEKMKQNIIKSGVNRNSIEILPDMTIHSGVVLAIGDISNYTES